jgi:hypothetical protein
MLLADRVYEDKSTGKKIVAGIFNRLLTVNQVNLPKGRDEEGNEVVAVPGGMHAGSPFVYFSLTDFQGQAPFVLRYVDLSDAKVLLHATFDISCQDPLATVEVVAPLPPLPTPHPGVYALELLCREEPVGSLRVVVEQINAGQEPGA